MNKETKARQEGRSPKKGKYECGQGYNPDDYIKRLEEERDYYKRMADMTFEKLLTTRLEVERIRNELCSRESQLDERLGELQEFANRNMQKDAKLWVIRAELLSIIDSLPFYRFFLKEKLQDIYSKIDSAWRI